MQKEKRGKAGELRIKEERSGEEGESDWMVEGEESGAKEQEESLRWISSDSAIAQVQLRKIKFETNIQTNPQGFIHVFTGPQWRIGQSW